MKLKFFQRRQYPQLPSRMELTHTVTHTIKHLPKPRPTRLQMTILNDQGQRWMTHPVNVEGQYIQTIYFPWAWVTGQTADNSKQVRIELQMEYDR